MNKRIRVIVVTYNGVKWIEKCLSSLFASTVAIKVLVVDNDSSDDTVDIIGRRFPDVEVIKSDKNVGFGQANNIGLRIALNEKADYAFLLNQDAWVSAATIETLVKTAEAHKDFGVISPIHYDASGEKMEYKFIEYIQPGGCPDLLEDQWFGRMKTIYETNFVNAAAWLLPVQFLKDVGGFDPLFPHYGEDVDYIQRIQHKGYKAGIVPAAFICHDSHIQPWSEIMWNRSRMYTIYLSELKNVNGSLRSNMLVFCKRRFDELTAALLYRQFKLFIFRLKLCVHVMENLSAIRNSRKRSQQAAAFL